MFDVRRLLLDGSEFSSGIRIRLLSVRVRQRRSPIQVAVDLVLGNVTDEFAIFPGTAVVKEPLP